MEVEQLHTLIFQIHTHLQALLLILSLVHQYKCLQTKVILDTLNFSFFIILRSGSACRYRLRGPLNLSKTPQTPQTLFI